MEPRLETNWSGEVGTWERIPADPHAKIRRFQISKLDARPLPHSGWEAGGGILLPNILHLDYKPADIHHMRIQILGLVGGWWQEPQKFCEKIAWARFSHAAITCAETYHLDLS